MVFLGASQDTSLADQAEPPNQWVVHVFLIPGHTRPSRVLLRSLAHSSSDRSPQEAPCPFTTRGFTRVGERSRSSKGIYFSDFQERVDFATYRRDVTGDQFLNADVVELLAIVVVRPEAHESRSYSTARLMR